MIYILEIISASVSIIPGPMWFQFFLLNWDHFNTPKTKKKKLKGVNKIVMFTQHFLMMAFFYFIHKLAMNHNLAISYKLSKQNVN